MATKKRTKQSTSTMAMALPLTAPAPSARAALMRWRDDHTDHDAGAIAIHDLAAAIVKRRPRAYRELAPILLRPWLTMTVDDALQDRLDDGDAPRLAAVLDELTVDDVRAAAGDDLADFSADELFAVVRGGAWRQWIAGDVATLRAHVAPRTTLPAPLLKVDVDVAIKNGTHRQLVEPLLRRAARATRALTGPPPIVLDDGYGYLDERRAFLDKAMQRRTPPPMATLRAKQIHVDEHGLAVDVDGTFAKEPVRLELPAARIDSSGSWAVDEAVWSAAFDVVNEPEPHEAAYFSRWFGGESVALLEALQAVVTGSSSSRTMATAGSERIAWQVQHQRDGLILTPRRQKAMKRGWSAGTALDPGRVLLDDDDVITGVDRHVASLLCGAKSGEGRALAALAGHPAVYDRDNRIVDVSVADVSVGIDDLPGGARRVSLRVGGRVVEPGDRHSNNDDDDHAVIGDDFVVLVDASAKVAHFTVGLLDEAMVRLARALRRTSVLPAALTPALRTLADTAAAAPSLDPSASTATATKLVLPDSLQGDLVPGAPRVVVRLALGEPLRLTATIAVIAGPGAPPALPLDDDHGRIDVDTTSAFVAGYADGRRVRYARSAAAERALVEPVRTALLDAIVNDDRFEPVDVTAWEIVADGDDALVLLRRAQGLQTLGVEVLWRDQRRLHVVGTMKASSVKLRVSAAREWLGLEGQGVIDGEAVALATLLAASREQRRFIALGPDRYVAVDRALREALGRVADLSSDDHDKKASGFAIEAPLAVAQALSSLRQAGAAIEDNTVWHDLEARLARAADVDDVPPTALLAELRPYQRDGLLFLRRLAAFGTGGVLADDMGLGKTVQAIGLLVDRVDVGPAIVVAPT
ncbi:MAG TPA: DEAD/DEAH box helicase, partial [Myxococcota bacterium]